MDDPSKGCGNFNDGRPMRKLTASLRIDNKSGKDMTAWYAVAYLTSGARAYTCYYGYSGRFPAILAGQSVEMTFAFFMEPNESVAYAIIADDEAGKSNRLTFP